ncbi:MAG TPA: YghX family hydrolase [Candidatus Anammoximicrobium sp.]|nr:YghX family hydrolase [Candidatus Anammoximicrobium sp.]
MERKRASEFEQVLLDLYDDYAHGRIHRRGFLEGAAKFAVGGLTAEALLATLSPNYAWAQQVAKDDPRLKTESLDYASPKGAGKMRGYLVRPASSPDKLPAVVVIHENRGLNPYIEDVTRRLGLAGFLAFAPDALTPLGGYPGNDDQGRELQSKRNLEEMTQDFIAAAELMQKHAMSSGKVGVVGFCYGGGVANELAVRIPDVIAAAVPFYGRQPATDEVPKIKASLLLHYAELDKRINAGWPAYEQALKAAKVRYEAHIYKGVNHGFHNDTTPRYEEAAAKLAWQRTVDFFNANLR